jgi:putative methyltransferase (TIGR04325 family)
VRSSSGYDSAVIAEHVAHGARQVLRGDAAFERDSVAFRTPEFNHPLIAALLRAATLSRNVLRVVDFGGSLGSSYYQSRHYLSGVDELAWTVVEQPAFASIGRAEFSDDIISFTEDLDAALLNGPPNVLLLSSVLQYLAAPHDFLDSVVPRAPSFVILDRMPLLSEGRDRLMVQNVPPSIYRASYPAWFLDRDLLLAHFASHYRIFDEFESFERWNMPWGNITSRGFILERTYR